jgi:hypothetical protein
MEAFGRTGRDLIPILEQGRDGIREMYGAVPDKQILSESDLQAAREYQLAVDDLNDAMQELKIMVGAGVVPALSEMATGLANVDSTNDKLTAATLSLAKRMAKNANPKIRPFKTADGREYYVAFAGSRAFRDFKADSTIAQANRDARAREGGAMNDNPLFQDGDQIWDGVIVREVPEISEIITTSSTFVTAGASSIPVEPVFLCGAQAMGIAWGQEPTPRMDKEKDYEFRPGVAIEELRGIQKMNFNGKQHGMVTIYVSGVGD